MPDLQLIARSRIVASARSWLGVPYVHQGRSKKGIDCIGLIVETARGVGLPIPPIPNNYTANPTSDMLLSACALNLQQAADPTKLLPGSIAVLWGFERGAAQHFAIVGVHALKPTMIHAFSKHRKVVEHGWDAFWMKRFVRTYEFPRTEPWKA